MVAGRMAHNVVAIDGALLEVLRARAEASSDQEVCGLLFGCDGRINRAVAATNVASDPATMFEIDPAMLIAALREERAGGPPLIGHYHSHPNGRAEPSDRDRDAAEPGRMWLILAGRTARLWLATEGGFTEMELVTDR